MSYLIYLLAMNPEIQHKLQEEIDIAVEEAGGKTPDYNIIQNLQYLDQVIHETLRMYPALGAITRACTENYVLKTPGENEIWLI
jgi:cytochrome P450 family 6